MSTIDLSKFRQNFVRDTAEDIKQIAAMKTSLKIGAGRHEVVVTGIHEKEGSSKFKLTDRLGGSLGFSLIVKNAKNEEQLIYVCVPLMVTFIQACRDIEKGNKFLFKKTFELLESLQVDPIIFRECIVATDGRAADKLKGAQLVIINSWRDGKLHLEYDTVAKAHFFTKSNGERFESGELSHPVSLDSTKKGDDKFTEFIAIARENGWELVTQMDTEVQLHPTFSNTHINDELLKELAASQSPKKPQIVNKTIPAFPIHTKKILASMEIEPDVEF